METFIGTILPVGFNFAPQGWALCNGQAMSIAQNTALFSLLGTTYGGDGVTTFCLPDLRGRVAVGQGTGPGLPGVSLGEMAGADTATLSMTGAGSGTLTTANMPSHNHGATFSGTGTTPVSVALNASTANGTSAAPTPGAYLGAVRLSGPGTAPSMYVTDPGGAPTVALNASTITVSGGDITGGTVSVDNNGSGAAFNFPVSVSGQAPLMQPYLGTNYIICLNGIYPSRP